jgi:hypothetical protein
MPRTPQSPGRVFAAGVFDGLPLWKLDLGITKKIKMTDR